MVIPKGASEEDGSCRSSANLSRSKSSTPTPRGGLQWSSSTACGCFRAVGIVGGASSTTRLYNAYTRRPDDPGTVEEAKAHPEVFANKTIGQVADHYAEVIEKLDKRPAVIGHSFGGLLAQMWPGVACRRQR